MFFFFKPKTADEMRISDCSSDVCSSDLVAALAEGLRANGLRLGDTVMLVSENRPEFCIADLAIMAAGGVTVPTYTTNTTRDHQHVLNDSAAKAVIISTAKLAKNLMP